MSLHADASQGSDFPLGAMPYASSWIDRLTGWIERIPGPSWGFYAAALPVLALMINVVFWIDGSQAVGTFEPGKTSGAVFMLFFLSLYHYLSRVAGHCFDVFRPAMKLPEADLQIMRFKLVNMPSWIGWLVLVAGTVLAVSNVLLNPLSFPGLDKANSLLPLIYQCVAFSLTLVTVLAVVIQLLRQLRFVTDLHRQAPDVDLFHLAPYHAFSRFTARAGGVLLLFVLFAGLLASISPPGVPIHVLTGFSLLAVCIFVIPLIGMQQRLADEKAQLLDATNEDIKVTIGRIRGELNADTYEKISGLNTAMSALLAERKIIEGISTWPWDNGTLRGFASTLVLPLVLWLVTRLLERFV